jgi:hypothetical protein
MQRATSKDEENEKQPKPEKTIRQMRQGLTVLEGREDFWKGVIAKFWGCAQAAYGGTLYAGLMDSKSLEDEAKEFIKWTKKIADEQQKKQTRVMPVIRKESH